MSKPSPLCVGAAPGPYHDTECQHALCGGVLKGHQQLLVVVPEHSQDVTLPLYYVFKKRNVSSTEVTALFPHEVSEKSTLGGSSFIVWDQLCHHSVFGLGNKATDSGWIKETMCSPTRVRKHIRVLIQ